MKKRILGVVLVIILLLTTILPVSAGVGGGIAGMVGGTSSVSAGDTGLQGSKISTAVRIYPWLYSPQSLYNNETSSSSIVNGAEGFITKASASTRETYQGWALYKLVDDGTPSYDMKDWHAIDFDNGDEVKSYEVGSRAITFTGLFGQWVNHFTNTQINHSNEFNGEDLAKRANEFFFKEVVDTGKMEEFIESYIENLGAAFSNPEVMENNIKSAFNPSTGTYNLSFIIETGVGVYIHSVGATPQILYFVSATELNYSYSHTAHASWSGTFMKESKFAKDNGISAGTHSPIFPYCYTTCSKSGCQITGNLGSAGNRINEISNIIHPELMFTSEKSASPQSGYGSIDNFGMTKYDLTTVSGTSMGDTFGGWAYVDMGWGASFTQKGGVTLETIVEYRYEETGQPAYKKHWKDALSAELDEEDENAFEVEWDNWNADRSRSAKFLRIPTYVEFTEKDMVRKSTHSNPGTLNGQKAYYLIELRYTIEKVTKKGVKSVVATETKTFEKPAEDLEPPFTVTPEELEFDISAIEEDNNLPDTDQNKGSDYIITVNAVYEDIYVEPEPVEPEFGAKIEEWLMTKNWESLESLVTNEEERTMPFATITWTDNKKPGNHDPHFYYKCQGHCPGHWINLYPFGGYWQYHTYCQYHPNTEEGKIIPSNSPTATSVTKWEPTPQCDRAVKVYVACPEDISSYNHVTATSYYKIPYNENYIEQVGIVQMIPSRNSIPVPKAEFGEDRNPTGTSGTKVEADVAPDTGFFMSKLRVEELLTIADWVTNDEYFDYSGYSWENLPEFIKELTYPNADGRTGAGFGSGKTSAGVLEGEESQDVTFSGTESKRYGDYKVNFAGSVSVSKNETFTFKMLDDCNPESGEHDKPYYQSFIIANQICYNPATAEGWQHSGNPVSGQAKVWFDDYPYEGPIIYERYNTKDHEPYLLNGDTFGELLEPEFDIDQYKTGNQFNFATQYKQTLNIFPQVQMWFQSNSEITAEGDEPEAYVVGDQLRKIHPTSYFLMESLDTTEINISSSAVAMDNRAKGLSGGSGLQAMPDGTSHSGAPVFLTGSNINIGSNLKDVFRVTSYSVDFAHKPDDVKDFSELYDEWLNDWDAQTLAHDNFVEDLRMIPYAYIFRSNDFTNPWILRSNYPEPQPVDGRSVVEEVTFYFRVRGGEVTHFRTKTEDWQDYGSLPAEDKDIIEGKLHLSDLIQEVFEGGTGLSGSPNDGGKDGSGWYKEDTDVICVRKIVEDLSFKPAVFTDKIPLDYGPRVSNNKQEIFKEGYSATVEIAYDFSSTDGSWSPASENAGDENFIEEIEPHNHNNPFPVSQGHYMTKWKSDVAGLRNKFIIPDASVMDIRQN